MGCSSCERRRLQREAKQKLAKQTATGNLPKQSIVAGATQMGAQSNVPKPVLYNQNGTKARSPFILYTGNGYTNRTARKLITASKGDYTTIDKIKLNTNRLARTYIYQNKHEGALELLQEQKNGVLLIDNKSSKWVDLSTETTANSKAVKEIL